MKERTAHKGYWLTQATLEDEASRTFAKKVAGFGNLDALYVEWTDEQKEQWEPPVSDEISDTEALNIILNGNEAE